MNWLTLSKMPYLLGQVRRTFRLMVGIPDYETYLAHIRESAEDGSEHRHTPTYGEFFRNCQARRYGDGSKISKCC